MADEPTTPAALTAVAEPPASTAAESTPAAAEPIEPTTGQQESRALEDRMTQEIDDFWAQNSTLRRDARGRFTKAEPSPDPEPVAEATTETVTETPAPIVADATPTPAETLDEATIEQRVRDRITAEQEATRRAEDRVRAESEHRQAVEAYRGLDGDYSAVSAALRAYNLTGDTALLDALDVSLATTDGVKTVSQIRGGEKGLKPEEAANVLNTWEIARRFEDVLGDRRVQRIVDLWNREVVAELAHEDVDADAVTRHDTPAGQMRALREVVTERVTKRVTAPLQAEIDRLVIEGKAKDERIASLLAERGNLTSQQRAAETAVVDRPGVGGGQSSRRGVPTSASEVREMSDREFDAVKDELFARLGNPMQPRRGMRRVV